MPAIAALPAVAAIPSAAPPVLHELSRTPSTGPDASALGVRRTFYQQHLVAAQYFADGAQLAEERGITGAGRDAVRRYRDLVAASVLSAAAFLEGSVNALVVELQEGGLTNGRRHSRRLHARLSREWRTHELAPTLHKYQLLLSLWDADPFHPRRSPCVQVDRLMRWRDVLVHRSEGPLHRVAYDSPASVPLGVTLHADTTDRTLPQTRRLRLNAECAQWAVHSAITFSNEFCCRMSLRARGFGEASG